MLIETGARFLFAGLRYEWKLGRGWYLAPSWAMGAFDESDAVDLGGTFEFRSALELGRRINGWSSLGISYDHVSNAGLHEENPGKESLVLIYSVDLRALLR